ncbi:virulence protein RhuM/Fic/DOC family protein [Olivibacter sitiensis]|uniref:virulence protein RhuM/Fic/DOC family protein n=1 Tax=Olivibacter sitiensis TaxID=376470 RepID=UPI0004894BCB|nr:virulence protein RhuM/Fic/DOC family protein [Olivibacter sitiensis]
MDKIILYQTENNQTQVEVQFDEETVWLSQGQIASLFGTQRPAITKHLNNIFKSGELSEEVVSSILEHTTQHGAIQGKTQSVKTKYYNLDAIISIGYRVNSTRATQFRQWATQRLKEYLVQGYAINQKRLDELQQTVQLIQKSISEDTNITEAKGLLEIISQYTQSFVLLNQYDSNTIKTDRLSDEITYEIDYKEAKPAILELKRQLIEKKEATGLFGNEKDNSFEGTLQSIVQTFGGQYLYPSIEEQAAHLLYFIIKNHPFTDGNKRIGAFMFIWFLEKNKHRFKRDGEIKINDNALVALALLVAQSDPVEKEPMIKLITQLINNR